MTTVTPVQIDVATGTSRSTILVGDGLIAQLPALLDAHGAGARRFVVSSPTIWKLHGEQVQ